MSDIKLIKIKYPEYFLEPYKGKTALRLKDTSNGFIAKFPSHTSTEQDYFICLTYEQAAYLHEALNKVGDL